MFLLFRSALLIFGFSLILLGCSTVPTADNPPVGTTTKPAPPLPQTVTLTAVGDFLMHMPVVQAAKTRDGAYDFKPIFSEVEHLLGGSDLTIVNLETRLAGKSFGFSGYPVFNTPEALALDMKDIGVDVVLTANNHSLDRGWPGVVNTLNNLEAAGLSPLGTHRSAEEAGEVFITEVKDIKIGILNYTESTNGIPLPKGKEFAVNLIEPQKIYEDIKKLKDRHAEIIIACLHFGTEYQRYPNEFQRKLVEDLFNRGVDIVFGDHVHVIQPMELQNVATEKGEKQCFVAYSLGNFISNQSWRYSNCGLIANVEVEKAAAGEIKIKNVDYVPVWVDTFVQNGHRKYRVLPVQKAIEDYQAGTDPLLTKEDYRTLQQVWQDTTALISGACPVIAPKNVPGGSKI